MHTIRCNNGHRYMIYHSSELAFVDGHIANKWYFHSYPAELGLKAGIPYESAAEAERAARAAARSAGTVADQHQAAPEDKRSQPEFGGHSGKSNL